MKTTIIGLLFVLMTALGFDSNAQSNAYYRITAAANVSVPAGGLAASIYVYSSGAVVLAADYNLVNASTPPAGTRWRVYYNVTSTTLGIHTCNFFGTLINGTDATQVGSIDYQIVKDHTGTLTTVSTRVPHHINSSPPSPTISGDGIIDNTLDYETKGVDLPSAQVLLGDAANRPTPTALTGPIAITNTGLTSIVDGTVVNADIAAGTGIARSKIANGGVDHVVINDGGGAFSSEATLNTLRGGLGIDASGSTGFVKFSAGTATISTIFDSQTFPVSFDTLEQCNNRFELTGNGTVTAVYATVTKAIAGTDNATLVMKNAAGTTMTTGTITFAASDLLNASYNISPSGNNTFLSGDILYATTSKVTPGGKALITVIYTRTP